jgi:signal transduction histidine kinase
MRMARLRAEAGEAEQRKAEAEVRRLNQDLEALIVERTAELETANSQLEAFAYTVSHDLRAPLRGMEGFARILLDDFAEALGPQGKRHAERIVAAARRMEGLINSLLAFSRLQRAEVTLRAIDPTKIARSAAREAQALGPLAPDEITIEIGAPLPAVMTEPVVLGQVISNLLTNAVKFRKEGEPARVRIWGERRGERVRIWVEDQGIGIAPEHQAKIFGAFDRLHGQETYPGAGIGLAIVKTGVERMGGTVGVESSPGAGARFWIELAAMKTTVERDEAEEVR